jgi:hypothetical protein
MDRVNLETHFFMLKRWPYLSVRVWERLEGLGQSSDKDILVKEMVFLSVCLCVGMLRGVGSIYRPRYPC